LSVRAARSIIREVLKARVVALTIVAGDCLCQSLRVAQRETETLAGKLAVVVSTNDWNALLQQMQTILTAESEVALFISQQFNKFASDARSAGADNKKIQSIRDGMSEFRERY
jgi:hypothetical protein